MYVCMHVCLYISANLQRSKLFSENGNNVHQCSPVFADAYQAIYPLASSVRY